MKRLFGLLSLSEGIQRYPNDRQLENLDERLIEIDIAGHGYSEKAIKKCGLRYLGPSFYENWGNNDITNGVCNDPEIQWQKDNQHHNPSPWLMNAIPVIKQTIGGNLMMNPWINVKDYTIDGFKQCADEAIAAGGVVIPYCHMHQGLKLYDLRGYGPRYFAEGTNKCVEAYMYHLGTDRMHGIFFDTASTRSVLSRNFQSGPNYAPEKEQQDLDELKKVTDFTRNFWRDNILDDEAIIAANSGNNASPGQLMFAKIDSVTLKEHYIETYPNFYTGVCPDADPKYANDLRCVNHSLQSWNDGVRKWREEFVNLIKYGPLDPQAQFVQGWNHPDTNQLMIDQFGEDMVTRFTRFALESHVGVVSYSHGGNGDPLAVSHEGDFYADLFARPEYQKCTGTWGEWEQWSNCDRSCHDGIRVRERACSEGDAGLCDGSERDMQVCNLEPCYQWPEKGWTHWAEWNACSVTCGGGKRDRVRTCKNDDNDCGGSDYEIGDCNTQACGSNQCPLELKINVPDSWHTEAKFPYKMYYHRTEDNATDQRPRYIKYAKDIELVYENNAWIVRDNDNNRIVLVSFTDAFCPNYIASSDWHYLDIPSGEFKSDQTITFENAKSGGNYAEAGDTSYSATNVPSWTEWAEWSNCDGTCGADARRTRTRDCDNDNRCLGAKVEHESCGLTDCTAEEKKLPCVADANGTRWRPIYKQWRSNGGIPKELENDIKDSGKGNNDMTYNANPPKVDQGVDYFNFLNFDNYEINGNFHMKLVWSKGESITWKQETSMFRSGIVKVVNTSEVVGQNHKGHSNLVFHGLSYCGPLRYNSLWDGLADMSTEAHRGYYHEVMDMCYQKTDNWPGYNVLIYDDGRQWDTPQYYSTWLSKTENETPPQDNGDPLLGEGEAIIGDDTDCMDTKQWWEYQDRGLNNDFTSLYIEDSSCPEPTESFPTFVRCYGAQANPSEDGSSCDCGDNATHDPATGMCNCNEGYVQTKYVFHRMPLCVKCNGPGATPGFYGCDCGIDMDYNSADGTCSCRDGLVLNNQGTECYSGIDMEFDGDDYDCSSSTAQELLSQLTDDISMKWGTTGNEGINCDKFEEPVVEISIQPGLTDDSSGTGAALIPSVMAGLREATLIFEFYLDDDMVLPQWHTFTLPGFFINGDDWGQFRIQSQNGQLKLNGRNCNFCDDAKDLAAFTVGVWTKVEQRIKLNDPGQSNGEYIIIIDGVEVFRRNDLSQMVPDEGDFNIQAYRLWTVTSWPAFDTASKVYYRQIMAKKFVSDEPPHVTTTPATTTYPVTTTPATTTTAATTSSTAATSTTATALECGCDPAQVALDSTTNGDGSAGSAVCTKAGKANGKGSVWTLYCGDTASDDPTRMNSDVKMGKNCKLKEILNCGAPTTAPSTAAPTTQGAPKCSFISDLEQANPDAEFTCIAEKGNKQTIECLTKDGDTSTKTGKKKSLLKWAISSSCKERGVFSCKCDNQTSVFTSITCVAENTYSCVKENGLMETFKVTKCKKLKKSKCARRN